MGSRRLGPRPGTTQPAESIPGGCGIVQNTQNDSSSAPFGPVRTCIRNSGLKVEVVVGIFHCGATLLKKTKQKPETGQIIKD